MTRNRNFRARTTYGNKTHLMDVATQLNGEEPRGFHDGLQILLRYFDILEGNVDRCPNCDSELSKEYEGERGWFELPKGKWACHSCDKVLNVWDYLGSADPERASIPGLPSTIRYRFECDHEHEETGMISPERSQRAQNQHSETPKTTPDRWDDGF